MFVGMIIVVEAHCEGQYWDFLPSVLFIVSLFIPDSSARFQSATIPFSILLGIRRYDENTARGTVEVTRGFHTLSRPLSVRSCLGFGISQDLGPLSSLLFLRYFLSTYLLSVMGIPRGATQTTDKVHKNWSSRQLPASPGLLSLLMTAFFCLYYTICTYTTYFFSPPLTFSIIR
ncbi:hypothetical protein F5Y08DRAFT_245058 [Xylaria arbuscula]|nr:hypothetical protein F5Y08DRAFT_245058 [Xylaria arbuscula]